jgi:hypothetical protein
LCVQRKICDLVTLVSMIAFGAQQPASVTICFLQCTVLQ